MAALDLSLERPKIGLAAAGPTMRVDALVLRSVFLLLLCCSTMALEGALPRFNIESTCRAAQAFAGADKKIAYNGCLRDEADARGQLAQKWARFRPQDRSDCVSQGAAPLPSYVELLTCLEMSAEADALNGPGGRNYRDRALWLNPPAHDIASPPSLNPAAPRPEGAPPAAGGPPAESRPPAASDLPDASVPSPESGPPAQGEPPAKPN